MQLMLLHIAVKVASYAPPPAGGQLVGGATELCQAAREASILH
jgi:hypothetical protein